MFTISKNQCSRSQEYPATTHPYYSVMLTSLKEPDFGCTYHVMRPANYDLALIATGILYRWVEYQVPFATAEKRDQIVNHLDNMRGFDCPDAGKVQEPFGKATYLSNYYQYLIMANTLPYIPPEEGEMKGMFCSETIVSAFNIALIIAHATLKNTLDEQEWSLDTYTSLDTFISKLHNPLPFDAKATLPAGIYEHCIKTPLQWTDKGDLIINPALESEREKSKEIWREFKLQLQADAPRHVRNLLKSPAPEALPIPPYSPTSFSPIASPRPSSRLDFLTLSHADKRSRCRSLSSPLLYLEPELLDCSASESLHKEGMDTAVKPR